MNFNSLYPKNYTPREIEKSIFQFLNDREIIVIRGPRQSGKTTLLARIGKHLEKKYPHASVIFLSFEDVLTQQKFETNPQKFLEYYLRGEKMVYFLLDEIQYIQEAGKILKFLFDTNKKVKFIVSGSSTLDLNQLGKYLVGRGLFFELYPFSFREFLKTIDRKSYLEYKIHTFSWKHPKEVESLHQERLQSLLMQYLIFGGYPRIVLEKNYEKKKILLRNILSTYLEKDILGLYGLKYKEKALVVLKYLATTIGNLINYHDICQITSLHFQELKEILHILEETYILRKVTPFHRNLITELKKNPKYYFLDIGLRNTLLEKFEFEPQELGFLLENYVVLALREKNLSFWRTTAKAEVDFIEREELIPIEVKVTPKITRSLMSFIDTYQPKFAIIANWKTQGKMLKNGTKIYSIPVTLL